MIKLKPLSNHIFIEPVVNEKTTKSGIFIPDTAEKEKPVKGKIIAAGPGRLNEEGKVIPMSVKTGDIVLFKKYGPDEIEFDGKKYLVGTEEDVMAILEN
jgi:chaperonin GroES